MSYQILNAFFDKIFVITLSRAVERQEAINNELRGVNYEFFYGEDKKNHTIVQLKKSNIYDEEKAKHFNRYNRPMELGHICCSLSHRNVYEEMIKNKWEKVLIFEDDVVAIKQNLKYISDILSQLPNSWELLYLGWEKNEKANFISKVKQGTYHIQHTLGLLKLNRMQINSIYPKKFSDNLKYSGFHDCSHAYGITLKAAKKLVHIQTPVVVNADSLLIHVVTSGLLEAYISIPKIFNQTSQYAAEKAHSYINEE